MKPPIVPRADWTHWLGGRVMKLGSNGMVGGEGEGESGRIDCLGVRAMRVRARCCRWDNSRVGDPAHYHKQQWGSDREGDVGGARSQVGCKSCDKVA